MKKNLFLSFLLLVIALGCKKDKSEPENPGVVFTEDINIFPFEIAVLQTQNLQLTEDFYSGTFNGMGLQLQKNGGQLYFIVPDIAPGEYKLAVNVKGKDYELDYIVKALAEIPDPGGYLQEKISDFRYTDEELDALKTHASGYPGSDKMTAQLEMVKTIYLEIAASLAGASAEEKEIAAKFISANPELFSKPEFFTDLTDHELFKTTSGNDAEAIARDLDKKINKACALILAGGVATAAILDFAPAQWKLAAGITGGATAGLIYIVNDYLTKASSSAIERFGDLIVSDMSQKKATSGQGFDNGAAYQVDVHSAYKNLNKSSLNNSSTVFKSIISALSTFETQWNKFFGLLPQWMVGKSFHIKNITAEKTKKLPVNPRYLNIKNINNNKVTAIVDKNGGKLHVSFKSDEVADQNFDYDLVYEAEGFETYTKRLSGILRTTHEIVGIWRHDGIAKDDNHNGVPDPEEFYDHGYPNDYIEFKENGDFIGYYKNGTDITRSTWSYISPGRYSMKNFSDEELHIKVEGDKMTVEGEEKGIYYWQFYRRQ